MIHVIIAMSTVLILLFSSGCTSIYVKTDTYKAKYSTMFEEKKFDTFSIKRSKAGIVEITLSDYKKEINNESIDSAAGGVGTIAGSAIKAATTV